MQQSRSPQGQQRIRASAYRLLVLLSDGYYPGTLEVGQGGGIAGYIQIHSIYRLARALGTYSERLTANLTWLEDQGYIEALTFSENRRTARLRLRRMANQ